jgi:hypothetical protein
MAIATRLSTTSVRHGTIRSLQGFWENRNRDFPCVEHFASIFYLTFCYFSKNGMGLTEALDVWLDQREKKRRIRINSCGALEFVSFLVLLGAKAAVKMAMSGSKTLRLSQKPIQPFLLE